VRRGCGECAPCLAGEADMCRTLRYREHGILRLDGFLTSHAIVEAEQLIPAPPELGLTAILAEPLSTAEKAVDVLRRAQRRVDHPCPHPEHGWDRPAWGGCKTALVAGLGPIGLLMALKLRLEGVQTTLVGIHDRDEPRVRWARELGSEYRDLRGTTWEHVKQELPPPDLAFEMTGSVEVARRLPDLLGTGGCLVLVGFAGGKGSAPLDYATWSRRMVVGNQAVVGVVSCKRRHVEESMRDLLRARARWGDLPERLITRRCTLEDYATALGPPGAEGVKVGVEER